MRTALCANSKFEKISIPVLTVPETAKIVRWLLPYFVASIFITYKAVLKTRFEFLTPPSTFDPVAEFRRFTVNEIENPKTQGKNAQGRFKKVEVLTGFFEMLLTALNFFALHGFNNYFSLFTA